MIKCSALAHHIHISSIQFKVISVTLYHMPQYDITLIGIVGWFKDNLQSFAAFFDLAD